MRPVRTCVVLVAIAGCASPGEPPPFGDTLAQVSVDGDGITHVDIAAPQGTDALPYTVDFPGPHVVRMPQSLKVKDAEVLATSGSCRQLGGVGVDVFPAVQATAPRFAGPNPAPSDDLTVTFDGPAVAQVRVQWEAAYVCGVPQDASGVTTFTMFPGGRIVRHDEATQAGQRDVEVMAKCACDGADPDPTSLTYESFWAFDPTGATGQGSDDQPRDGSFADPQGCAMYSSFAIGYSGDPAATQWTTPGTFANVFAQASVIKNDQKDTVNAIQLSSKTACSQVVAGLADPKLAIDQDTVNSDQNGIYVDDSSHTGPFQIAPAAGDPIPGGFAVLLNIDPHATITRTPATDDSFFRAQVSASDGRVLVWFRDDLHVGESITVEPQE